MASVESLNRRVLVWQVSTSPQSRPEAKLVCLAANFHHQLPPRIPRLLRIDASSSCEALFIEIFALRQQSRFLGRLITLNPAVSRIGHKGYHQLQHCQHYRALNRWYLDLFLSNGRDVADILSLHLQPTQTIILGIQPSVFGGVPFYEGAIIRSQGVPAVRSALHPHKARHRPG